MVKRLLSVILIATLVMFTGVASPAFAGETGTQVPQAGGPVVGTIVDAAGQGIIGAGVLVKGTTVGATTDMDGNFTIANAAKGAVLQIQCIGYKSVEVTWNGGPVDIVLQEDNEMLNEVVVTALGISREKKSLGYAVQDVKADQITRGGEVALTDALQGKVAGLTIQSSSAGVGGTTRVVIRGNSSLSDNNAPLYVVDGVPFDTSESTGSQSNVWGGTERAGGAFDLNPEDVESVSVLKGPTAAALYGSRAGNGVILITTKKGGAGENGQWGVSYAGKVSVSPIAYTLDLQNTYGQGVGGSYVKSEYSWGGKLGSGSIPAWYDESQSVPYTVQEDPMNAFYQTGVTHSHNVTVAGGKKENPFRLSLGYDNTQGVISNNSISKTSVDLVDKLTVNKYLNFEVKANYIHTVGNNRPNLGYYGTPYTLYTMPRNIKVADLAAYWVDPDQPGSYVQQNWWGPNPNNQNPYWILNQENNRDTKDRLFGSITANINFTDHLTLKLKQGLDYSGTEYKTWYLYNDVSFVGRPSMGISRYGARELNSEALLSYNNNWDNWSFGANLGGNIMNNKSEGVYGFGKAFPLIGAQFVGLGTSTEASNSIYEKQINSVYGFVNVGFKNWLFVDLTARNDWSSTLPADNRSYFYPSASASALINGIFDAYGVDYNKDVLDYGKVRVSFAQVGKDTEPYQLMSTYGTSSDWKPFGLLVTSPNTTKANSELKPEIATSWEVGTEWHFFKNRLGIDFTYYNTVTKNQVMAITQPETSGYEAAYKNVGQISNKGIELMITGEFIRTKNFDFGATVNFAHNVSMVDELTDGVSMYSLGTLGTVSSQFQVIAQEGQKLGQLYDYGFKRDASGNVIVGSNGLPLTSDTQIVLGDIQPDFTGSFNLFLDYKGFSANALFNFQKGGEIFSASEMLAAKMGTAKCTEDRSSIVFDGVTESGQKNTVAVDAETYWKNANVENFIYDASYIKLQEVSLSYNFSKKLIQNADGKGLSHLKLSLYGTNLLYLFKNTPGTTPDGSATSSSMFGAAVDMTPVPNTRTFGLSLNIGF